MANRTEDKWLLKMPDATFHVEVAKIKSLNYIIWKVKGCTEIGGVPGSSVVGTGVSKMRLMVAGNPMDKSIAKCVISTS